MCVLYNLALDPKPIEVLVQTLASPVSKSSCRLTTSHRYPYLSKKCNTSHPRMPVRGRAHRGLLGRNEDGNHDVSLVLLDQHFVLHSVLLVAGQKPKTLLK